MDFYRLLNLLKGDMIAYYELGDKVDTPLKAKYFPETEEYSKYADRFEQEQELISEQIFSTTIKCTEKYDMDSHRFRIEIPYFMTNPLSIFRACREFQGQYFHSPVIEERKAYEIESVETDFTIFYQFGGDGEGNAVIIPLRVVISNSENGKILWDYEIVIDGNQEMDEQAETGEEADDSPTQKEEPTLAAETQPEFPGGDAALLRFLSETVNYPTVCQEFGIQGRVIVQFTVDKDGSVISPKVTRSPDDNLGKEALRVVRKMPKWIPGTLNGVPVRCQMTVPINFRLW